MLYERVEARGKRQPVYVISIETLKTIQLKKVSNAWDLYIRVFTSSERMSRQFRKTSEVILRFPKMFRRLRCLELSKTKPNPWYLPFKSREFPTTKRNLHGIFLSPSGLRSHFSRKWFIDAQKLKFTSQSACAGSKFYSSKREPRT